MFDLNDPDMREIVVDFCNESFALMEELESSLESFEDDSSSNEHLEKFGQTIDRMMGAAQTIGANEIGDLCKMGKIIGYKASQNDSKSLNEMICGVLFDLLDVLNALIQGLKDQKGDEHEFNIEAFRGRLRWASDKLKHIKRASCSFDGEDESEEAKVDATPTAELEALISRFGKAS